MDVTDAAEIRLARWARILPRLAAVGVLAGAILTTAGWLRHSTTLTSLFGQGEPAKPIAALLFLWISASLIARSAWPNHRVTRCCLAAGWAASAAIGVVTLIEHSSGASASVFDRALRDWSGADGAAGRPAPQAAACMVVLGAAMLAPRHWRLARDIGGAVVAGIAMSGVVGHATGVTALYTLGRGYDLPAPVAGGFVLLLVAAFGAMDRRDTEMQRFADAGPAGVFLRTTAVLAFVVPTAAGLLRPALERLGSDAADVKSELFAAAVVIGVAVVWSAGRLLEREHVAQERELDLFRSLATTIGDVITVFDGAGRYTQIYGSMRYGITSDDAVGCTPVELLGEGARAHYDHVREAAEGVPSQYEWAVTIAGDRHIFSSVAAPLHGDDPESRVVASSREITGERRKDELFRAVIDNSPSSVYIASTGGRIELVNRHLADLLGTTPGEVVGRSRREVAVLAADASAHEANDRLVAATHTPITVEERLGERTFISVKFPIADDTGETIAVGGISTDITELRRVQLAVDHAWHETLRRLAMAVDYRDEETGAHVERMSRLSGRIADRLGFSTERRDQLIEAAALHDLGKVAIPDDVLRKPGPLTATERALMETHTTVGYALLSDSGDGLLDLAASIARSHHERWDGNGYPERRRGNEIPLEARIAAVADVYDALTSPRPYRAPMSEMAAIDLMIAERGRHFDPIVLDAFLTLDRHPSPAASI